MGRVGNVCGARESTGAAFPHSGAACAIHFDAVYYIMMIYSIYTVMQYTIQYGGVSLYTIQYDNTILNTILFDKYVSHTWGQTPLASKSLKLIS